MRRTEQDASSIGARLRAARAQLALNQSELAAEVGITQSSVAFQAESNNSFRNDAFFKGRTLHLPGFILALPTFTIVIRKEPFSNFKTLCPLSVRLDFNFLRFQNL